LKVCKANPKTVAERFLGSRAGHQLLLRTIQFLSPSKNHSVHIGIHRLIGVQIEGEKRKRNLGEHMYKPSVKSRIPFSRFVPVSI
jgi:hypothetical protein